jgi:hypothetical protein
MLPKMNGKRVTFVCRRDTTTKLVVYVGMLCLTENLLNGRYNEESPKIAMKKELLSVSGSPAWLPLGCLGYWAYAVLGSWEIAVSSNLVVIQWTKYNKMRREKQ